MANNHALLDAGADFFAGWVGGCAGVLVSHPFDTVKVRLQSQSVDPSSVRHYRGTWHCLVDTVKHEKFHGLFKGMSSPLLGTAAWNAVCFGAYGNTIRRLAGSNEAEQHRLTNVAIAGVASGIAQVPIICPLELTKTRLQIQSSSKNTVYKGLIDCVLQIWRSKGFLGLYKGVVPTFCRDIIGFPVYFVAFELGCRIMSSGDTPDPSDLGMFSLSLAGGVAGAISWGTVFPQDVIKCRIQVDYTGQYRGMLHCIRKSFREDGWQLFRGKGMTANIMRAFPSSAAIFTVYTVMMRSYNTNMREYEVT